MAFIIIIYRELQMFLNKLEHVLLEYEEYMEKSCRSYYVLKNVLTFRTVTLSEFNALNYSGGVSSSHYFTECSKLISEVTIFNSVVRSDSVS